jgi:hypothetical protein
MNMFDVDGWPLLSSSSKTLTHMTISEVTAPYLHLHHTWSKYLEMWVPCFVSMYIR